MGLHINMKINVSYPATGAQKLFEILDPRKVEFFNGHRMSNDVAGDQLGDEWKGYVFRICGGNDKQGFPMKQGVLSTGRVRILLGKNHSCYRQRRTGERKRKSVRGCIVDSNLSVLALAIVKKGEGEIPGLTDTQIPKKLGPKELAKSASFSIWDLKMMYASMLYVPPKPVKKVRRLSPLLPRFNGLSPLRLFNVSVTVLP